MDLHFSNPSPIKSEMNYKFSLDELSRDTLEKEKLLQKEEEATPPEKADGEAAPGPSAVSSDEPSAGESSTTQDNQRDHTGKAPDYLIPEDLVANP